MRNIFDEFWKIRYVIHGRKDNVIETGLFFWGKNPIKLVEDKHKDKDIIFFNLVMGFTLCRLRNI